MSWCSNYQVGRRLGDTHLLCPLPAWWARPRPLMSSTVRRGERRKNPRRHVQRLRDTKVKSAELSRVSRIESLRQREREMEKERERERESIISNPSKCKDFLKYFEAFQVFQCHALQKEWREVWTIFHTVWVARCKKYLIFVLSVLLAVVSVWISNWCTRRETERGQRKVSFIKLQTQNPLRLSGAAVYSFFFFFSARSSSLLNEMLLRARQKCKMMTRSERLFSTGRGRKKQKQMESNFTHDLISFNFAKQISSYFCFPGSFQHIQVILSQQRRGRRIRLTRGHLFTKNLLDWGPKVKPLKLRSHPKRCKYSQGDTRFTRCGLFTSFASFAL